jgi:hypothetical protein
VSQFPFSFSITARTAGQNQLFLAPGYASDVLACLCKTLGHPHWLLNGGFFSAARGVAVLDRPLLRLAFQLTSPTLQFIFAGDVGNTLEHSFDFGARRKFAFRLGSRRQMFAGAFRIRRELRENFPCFTVAEQMLDPPRFVNIFQILEKGLSAPHELLFRASLDEMKSSRRFGRVLDCRRESRCAAADSSVWKKVFLNPSEQLLPFCFGFEIETFRISLVELRADIGDDWKLSPKLRLPRFQDFVESPREHFRIEVTESGDPHVHQLVRWEIVEILSQPAEPLTDDRITRPRTRPRS